jgi:hypothetical protein
VSCSRLIIAFAALFCGPALVHAGTVRQAEGTSAVVVEGVSSEADSKVGEPLPEGAIVTTGNDGFIVIEVAPGILIELQPDAQVTIGAIDPAGGLDSDGNTIPRVSVNLISGGLVVHATGTSAETAAVLVVTPKGSFSPVSSGVTYVNATAATLPDGNVTVASVAGSGIVTTTEGDPVVLGDGLMVVLGATSPSAATTISGSTSASQITEVAQSSASRIASLPPSPISSPAVSHTSVTPMALQSIQPLAEPSPSPIPISSGLAIDLRPEGACFPVPSASLPDVQEDLKAMEATVSQVTSLGDVARTAKTRYSLWVVERSMTRT